MYRKVTQARSPATSPARPSGSNPPARARRSAAAGFARQSKRVHSRAALPPGQRRATLGRPGGETSISGTGYERPWQPRRAALPRCRRLGRLRAWAATARARQLPVHERPANDDRAYDPCGPRGNPQRRLLRVVLEQVLVSLLPRGIEVWPPARRDELERRVVGDVTAALHVHPLEQVDGAEDLAGGDARGERERAEDLRSERPDVREAGLHQLQMPTVAGWALLRAADRVLQSRGSQAADGAADLGVVEVWVEDDVEDVVQQHETIEIRVERVELAFGDLVTGVPVGRAEHHVEHADRLIDDLRVRRGERGEQDRVAALGVHLPQRSRRRAPRDGRELPQPLGWNRTEIEAVRAQVLKIGELRNLSLRRVAGRGRRPVPEPHQPRDAQLRVAHQQPVELLAPLGCELGTQTPADLLATVDACGRYGSHQTVKAGPDDPLGSQLVKRLPEQDRGRVVLQRPLDQPPSERAPLALPACPPAGVLDDRGNVTPARAAVRVPRVASERAGRNAELLADVPGDLRRRIAKRDRNEPEEPHGGELDSETDPLTSATV